MSEWTWEYEGHDPDGERLREALCTLGNGYFATRGAVPECRASLVHYPGTYAAGVLNRLESEVAGRRVVNEDLVNLPNWLPLRFRVRRPDGTAGAWFRPGTADLLAYRHVLDVRRGTLTRTLRFRDPVAGVIAVEQVRLVHLGEPHLAALRTTFTAEDGPAELEVESLLDGDVINGNVHRYRALNQQHLTRFRTGAPGPDLAWLTCRTSGSRIRVALAARTVAADGAKTPDGAAAEEAPAGTPGGSVADATGAGAPEGGAGSGASAGVAGATAPAGTSPVLRPRRAGHRLVVRIAPGRPAVVDKTASLHTSRDPATADPLEAALDDVRTAPGFPALLASHEAAWARLWRETEVDAPGETGRILRLHAFHVLQTLSPHTAALDVGVPARGLHGEAYRGHVFWDEVFVLPYLNLCLPEVSRALLTYRYRRLPRACRAAREAGRAGALYPWQSGSDGREETQRTHLNPRSGRWLPDHTHLQHHVGSAIAWNVWQYAATTGDTDFLHGPGAETLLQIARFWSSGAQWDPDLGRWRIRGVLGPDEYHDAYPGADRPGLDDNAYTNVTAAWVLARALDLVHRLLPARRRDALLDRLDLNGAELERWEEISRRLRVPFHEGVISQFDGWGDLAELDWEAYRARYGDIRRLDRILEAEGDTVNRYRAAKQADALMLGHLFPPAELRSLFDRLGYTVDDTTWNRTVDHYLRRTSHGSTLSALVHGLVLARARRPADAWEFVHEALLTDVADVQGGTTGEGIHLGAMAGTLDLVQRGLTGLAVRDGTLVLDPVSLPPLSDYAFTLRLRGHWGVGVRRRGARLEITAPEGDGPLHLIVRGRPVTVEPGRTRTLDLPED